ncbi:MAG: hypothetical protein C3F11_11495 [Methylocystaceae bacterium]|nr:MAG: hypothetical protein C3F11_11495 [Methylocystaceae bacterium]
MNISKLASAGVFAATLGYVMPAGLAHAGPLGLSASAAVVAPPSQIDSAYYRRHWRGYGYYRPYYRHAYRAYPRYYARPYYYPSYGYYPRYGYPAYGWPGAGFGWGW